MKKKIYNLVFIFLMVISIILPNYVLAVPSNSFTNITEIRSNTAPNSPLTGYNGALREVGGNASTYGYYLGTTNQYLPYKVGNVQRGTLDYKGENVTIDGNSYALFCTEFGNLSPADNSYINITQGNYSEIANGTLGITCTRSSDWSLGIQAGVGAIIKNVTNGQPVFSNASLSKYYDGEIAINQFLYEKLGNSINHQNSDGSNVITNYDSNLIELANKAYEKATKEFSVAWPSNKQLSYSDNDKIWKSEHISVLNIQYLDNYNPTDYSSLYSAVLKDSTGKIYEKYAYITNIGNGKIQVGVCNNNTSDYCKDISNYTKLPAGNYTVSVTIGQENGKTYPIATNYTCSGKQDVTPAYTEIKTENSVAIANFSFTIANEEIVEEKTGSITIEKIDVDTKEKLDGAKVKIECISSGCTYITTIKDITNGSITVNALPLGTYKITEIVSPTGYQLDNNYYTVIIKESVLNEKVTIENKKILPGKGSIKVIKIDSTTKNEITGAIISLVCKDCEEKFESQHYMDEGTIVIKDLPYGIYEITEFEAPQGYDLSNEIFTVTLDEQTQSDEITIENNLKVEEKGTVVIKKIDSETKEYVIGAIMRIVDKNGEEFARWTTTNSTYSIDLPYGTYILEEVSAPEHYSTSNTRKQFEIKEGDSNISLEFANDKIVDVPNTLTDLSIILIILGLVGLSSGSWLIYSNYKKEEQI